MFSRRTPNKALKFKQVPRRRNDFRLPSGNVAAIDFGTVHCSLAYKLKKIKEIHLLRLDSGHNKESILTAVIFKDGKVANVGRDAQDTYSKCKSDERSQYTYFDDIKMLLQQDSGVNRDMTIKPRGQKEDYYYVDVIAHILRWMKNQFLKRIATLNRAHDLQALDWVVTVPSIWRDRGKQMMREAAYKAGLCSDQPEEILIPVHDHSHGRLQLIEKCPERLFLAHESESAAIHCLNMSDEERASFGSMKPHLNSRYMVVDIGGGTVDITAYAADAKKKACIRILEEPAGNSCGGTRIDKAFLDYLGEVVQDKGFSRYLEDDKTSEQRKAFLKKICISFEDAKRKFGNTYSGNDGPCTYDITLPAAFTRFYSKELTKPAGDQVPMDEDEDELHISHTRMESFFQMITPDIVACVTKVANAQEIETVYLVGGFGGCQYIHDVVTKELPNCNVTVPLNPDTAVVRGAALSRCTPELVWSRVADSTYGIRSRNRFDRSVHEEHYRVEDHRQQAYCRDLFQVFIEHGEEITQNIVYTNVFTPFTPNQQSMCFEVFSTPKSASDVPYVLDKEDTLTVSPLGSITLELTIEEESKQDREIELMIDFSYAEMFIKACDKKRGTEIKSTVDFLSATYCP